MHASDNNNSRGPAFWLNTGIVAVAILMAATVAVSVRGISNLYHAQEQVLRSQQSMLGLERLLSLAKDAETGQRGYLLTGDEQYLKPYRDALAAFEQQWQSVERSVHDGPAQRTHLARLKELFAAKFEELAMTVATRRERGLAAAQQLVITNRGKQTMDAARAEVAAIGQRRNCHRQHSRARRDSARHRYAQDERLRCRAQQAAFDRHLVKPVDSAELAAALQVTRDASLEASGQDRRPS